MKRVILLLSILVLLTGCVSVKKSSLESITEEVLNSKTKLYNHSSS